MPSTVYHAPMIGCQRSSDPKQRRDRRQIFVLRVFVARQAQRRSAASDPRKLASRLLRQPRRRKSTHAAGSAIAASRIRANGPDAGRPAGPHVTSRLRGRRPPLRRRPGRRGARGLSGGGRRGRWPPGRSPPRTGGTCVCARACARVCKPLHACGSMPVCSNARAPRRASACESRPSLHINAAHALSIAHMTPHREGAAVHLRFGCSIRWCASP
jgi:hypothetical protein